MKIQNHEKVREIQNNQFIIRFINVKFKFENEKEYDIKFNNI